MFIDLNILSYSFVDVVVFVFVCFFFGGGFVVFLVVFLGGGGLFTSSLVFINKTFKMSDQCFYVGLFSKWLADIR